MKDGWEIKTIGDICFVGGGSTPRRTEKAFWENGTYPWFSIDDIRDQGRIITDTKQKITKLAWNKMRVFPANSVLLCCTASVGEYALSTIPITSNQQFNGLTIKDHEQMLPMYLFYFCSTLKPVLQGLSGRATIDFVSSEKVRQLRIPYPSLPEQQRIVDILDREFAGIDALKANAEKSLQTAKDLFYQMLSHTFSNPSWSWERIGDVFDTGAGGTPLKTYKEYYENGDIPWLRSGEVCRKYITETEMFITQLGMDNSSAKMFPKNAVVVAMYGATAGQVGILHLETTTNQAVCGIFPRKNYVPEFIYYSLLNSKKGLVAQATGNAQPNISQIKIKNTTIPVISREEQEEVVSRLDDLNDKCDTLQQNYQKTLTLCDDLKQSLLRKAFNGEL